MHSILYMTPIKRSFVNPPPTMEIVTHRLRITASKIYFSYPTWWHSGVSSTVLGQSLSLSF